jgi:uncharacterized protein (DUF362 family)
MNPIKVAICKYERGQDVVKQAVEKADAFADLPKNAKVIIKPNIVVWLDAPYPKYGVVTTSAVVEETVELLRAYGIDDIAIAEGSLQVDPQGQHIGAKSFEGLGYNKLKRRYGVKLWDVWERPFQKVEVAAGIRLRVNEDLMTADYLVNLPVLKTHAQVKVSLGLKNLKGFLDVASRKKCHRADTEKDLEFMIARLTKLLPPSATIIDGIYTLERGPSIDGAPRRSDIVIASSNVLAADMIGAEVLGYDPADIRYLMQACQMAGFTTDGSGIEVVGKKVKDVAASHQYAFPYNQDGTLPRTFEKMGIQGLKFHKFDSTVCTYCSPLIGMLLTIIAMSYKGKPFDDVEFLCGKRRKPSDDMKKSILVGQCMCQLNKDHAGPQEIVEISGCPPKPKEAAEALRGIGIEIPPSVLTDFDTAAGFFMERFKGQTEFDDSFFTIFCGGGE